MKRINNILVLLLVFVSFSGQAQNTKQLIKAGDHKFLEGDYYSATIFYKDALTTDSSNIELNFKMAESLRGFNDYKLAVQYYEKVTELDNDEDFNKAYFWLATMQKSTQSYENAKKNFTTYLSFITDKNSFEYKKTIQEIKSCEWAILNSNDSIGVLPQNIGKNVNTVNSEFGAMLLDDSLVFSSLRADNMGEDLEIYENEYSIKLYHSKAEDPFKPLEANLLDEDFNQGKNHIANGTYSTDRKKLYFTVCNDSSKCKIFVAKNINGYWKNPSEVIGLNKSQYTYTQPHYVEINNKEYLFFTSDKEGSIGGLDIWYGELKDYETIIAVKNIGSEVNTLGNEITPFFLKDSNHLYFSSDWHLGYGGFDVFKSKKLGEQFKKPQNLMLPTNSPANDLYYSAYVDKELALVTSNRLGSYFKKAPTCCNDIWIVDNKDTTEPEQVDTSLFVADSSEGVELFPIVTLYFHNDHPNPRSWNNSTNLNYLTTYENYVSLVSEYKKELTNGLVENVKSKTNSYVEDFFTSKVRKGVDDLDTLTKLVLKNLEKGNRIELTVRGFASPLAKTDYNVHLTSRRISSFINYLNEYNEGVFKKYLNGPDPALKIKKSKFGEYTANQEISDNLYDKPKSVYSIPASLERKIEIRSIKVIQEDDVYADILFDKEVVDFKYLQSSQSLKTATFTLSNSGNDTLRLSKLEFTGSTITYKFDQTILAPNESTKLEVSINTSSYKGINGVKLYVISNALDPRRELTLAFETQK